MFREGEYITKIVVEPKKRDEIISDITVLLRKPEKGKIVSIENSKNTVFYIIKPAGKYGLEIESPGFRRIWSEFEITAGCKQEYTFKVKTSKVPLSIQRLYPAKYQVANKKNGRNKTEDDLFRFNGVMRRFERKGFCPDEAAGGTNGGNEAPF